MYVKKFKSMSDNLGYWYNGGGSNSISSELPPQAIATSKKTPKWWEANMDALERIGIKQYYENQKFKDLYRMTTGKMAYSELADVIPQLREVGEMLEDMEIPTFIKHYDLIGIIINALIGEYTQNTDKYNVTNIDEISTTEYERTKKDLVTKYIKEELNKEFELKLIKEGMNPNPDEVSFQSEEEKQAYIQQIQQRREELTPPEIEKFMNTKWRTKASLWGEYTLEADKEKYYLDELDRYELRDFLLTGRCFRHFRVGYDSYEPETWSPLNTFFSQEVDTKYVQNGQYVGRVHFYAPHTIINKYGHLLTKTQKEKLVGRNNYNYDGGSNQEMGFGQNMNKNFGETHIVPHAQYYDYKFMLSLQDEFGVPMGRKTMMKKDGTEEEVSTFLPDYNSKSSLSKGLATGLRDDLNLRDDLLQVTEAYWVSYKKIGYLTYTTESGRITQDIVTDDILTEFLTENNIKQLNNVTLEEAEKNPQPNTIVWDYIPEVCKGVKINEGQLYLEEPIYLDMKPLEFQLKGNSNIFDMKLPVSGIISNSLALKMQPFQVSYNVVMNQLYNLLEKEIGLFFIFDINFLPSEFKEWGDTEETLVHLRNLTKDVGLFPVDSSKQNVKDGGGFNQFAPQNLSFSGQIADRMNLSEFYKNKTFEQIGFNNQRLGAPMQYETATSVKQSQKASYAQTEVYFEEYGDYKKRTLEMHLNVAQYAQKEGKDLSVYYSKSDSSKAYLKFSDPYFPLRRMGILPISNSKKRKELEDFKSYLLNTNTLGGDEMAIAELFTSDTMVELIDVSRAERLRRSAETQAEREHQIGLIQQQSDLEEQKEIKKWEREEYSNEQDRLNKIEIERIESLGRAVDNDADISRLNFIMDEADLSLKRSKTEADISLGRAELNRKSQKDKDDFNIRMQELKNKTLEIQAKLKESGDKKYIAEINKN